MSPDPTGPRPYRVPVVFGLLALVALGASFYFSGNQGEWIADVETGQITAAQMQQAHADLCNTRSVVVTDPIAARESFFGRVHNPLHDIAREVEAVDRTAAARFLEAKNDVEQSFNQRTSTPQVAQALDRLLRQTEQALRSLGVTTSNCAG